MQNTITRSEINHTPLHKLPSSALPVFPEFKKLELDDKPLIEMFVKNHPPYSDFNFVSLWAYNTDGQTSISSINGNLILKMRNYTTDDIIYSLLGNNKLDDSIKTILRSGIKVLNLIPETVIDTIRNNQEFHIEEEPHNFDYIYSIADLKDLPGQKYERKRRSLKYFLNNYKWNVDVVHQLNDEIEHKLKDLYKRVGKDDEGQNELIALSNCLYLFAKHKLSLLMVYVENELAGFTISEQIHHNHSIGHFAKADTKYNGIWEMLFHKTAEHHHKNGSIFFNHEQDLGIEGLKKAKELWRPTYYLKKYKISLNVRNS